MRGTISASVMPNSAALARPDSFNSFRARRYRYPRYALRINSLSVRFSFLASSRMSFNCAEGTEMTALVTDIGVISSMLNYPKYTPAKNFRAPEIRELQSGFGCRLSPSDEH